MPPLKAHFKQGAMWIDLFHNDTVSEDGVSPVCGFMSMEIVSVTKMIES